MQILGTNAATHLAVVVIGWVLVVGLGRVGRYVSGAGFSSEALPELAQRIGAVLPFTYAVRAIRAAWTVGATDWTASAVLAATVVVAVPIALRTFLWAARH